jgi:uncharacterized protein (TIGR03067 family)
MKTVARAFALLPLLALVGCSGAEPGNRSAEEQVGPDEQRLLGMWEVIEFQAARPGEGPAPDKLQAIRLVFTSDRLTISVGTEWKEHFQYTIDPTRDPKWMTVVEEDGRPRPTPGTNRTTAPAAAYPGGERSEWIYKFEGDTLVIAVADPGAPRPLDFTPRAFSAGGAPQAAGAAPQPAAGGRVDVIRLRKTTMPAGGPRYGYGTYRGTAGGYGTAYGTYRGGGYPSYRGTSVGYSTSRAVPYSTSRSVPTAKGAPPSGPPLSPPPRPAEKR